MLKLCHHQMKQVNRKITVKVFICYMCIAPSDLDENISKQISREKKDLSQFNIKSNLKYCFPCRGLFITMHDKGHIYDVLCNWPEHEIKVSHGKQTVPLISL